VLANGDPTGYSLHADFVSSMPSLSRALLTILDCGLGR
jgi:hypothetical protein